jgi:hypothetical protein
MAEQTSLVDGLNCRLQSPAKGLELPSLPKALADLSRTRSLD